MEIEKDDASTDQQFAYTKKSAAKPLYIFESGNFGHGSSGCCREITSAVFSLSG